MAPVRKILKYLVPGFFTLLAVNYFFFRRTTVCGMGREHVTIATITYGPFVEYIPQTGEGETDTISGCHNVQVSIDEFYASRISVGLKATTTFRNTDYDLEIVDVWPNIVDGRFSTRLCFNGEIPAGLSASRKLRLRILLGGKSNQILLPVGGFYKDTGGNWIFLIENGKAVRRNIVLGRKSGSEYFEVLEGLAPGDCVITSSYENFIDEESIDMNDLKRLATAD